MENNDKQTKAEISKKLSSLLVMASFLSSNDIDHHTSIHYNGLSRTLSIDMADSDGRSLISTGSLFMDYVFNTPPTADGPYKKKTILEKFNSAYDIIKRYVDSLKKENKK